jgi:hypothetical protein
VTCSLTEVYALFPGLRLAWSGYQRSFLHPGGDLRRAVTACMQACHAPHRVYTNSGEPCSLAWFNSFLAIPTWKAPSSTDSCSSSLRWCVYLRTWSTLSLISWATGASCRISSEHVVHNFSCARFVHPGAVTAPRNDSSGYRIPRPLSMLRRLIR